MMHEWQPVRKFNSYNHTDVYSFSFQPLPGFDMQDLPIIVAKSKKEICLFNAEQESIEKLVANTNLESSTRDTFVLLKTATGLKLHFLSLDKETRRFWQWHCMPLYSDFEEQMRKHGQLPFTSISKFSQALKNEAKKLAKK